VCRIAESKNSANPLPLLAINAVVISDPAFQKPLGDFSLGTRVNSSLKSDEENGLDARFSGPSQNAIDTHLCRRSWRTSAKWEPECTWTTTSAGDSSGPKGQEEVLNLRSRLANGRSKSGNRHHHSAGSDLKFADRS
jgi:hypothetical protein